MAHDKSKHHSVPHNMLMANNHIRQLDVIGEFWDNVQFIAMMPCLGLLETLVIKDDKNQSSLTGAILHQLPHPCPYIITLSLSPTIIKQSSCWDAIGQHCHQLRKLELHINHYNNQHYRGIFKALGSSPSLTILNLYGGQEHITDNYFHQNMVQSITKLHQLTDFALLGNFMSTIHMLVNAIHITSTWPLLSSLSISHGSHLTDSFMIPFIESHPHIQSLDLAQTAFSDSTLDTIATRLHHISDIRFVDNPNITPGGVYKLVRHCHDLKQADFSKCGKLVNSMTEFSGLRSMDPAVLTLEQMKKIRQSGSN